MASRLQLKLAVFARYGVLAAVVVLVAGLAGCGSTKVYTADKTVVYRESVYNVSNVKVFTRKNAGVLADQSTVDLSGVDKKGFEKLLESSPSIALTQSFMLDDTELKYQQATVSSWKDFNKMNKRFLSASKDLNKFLANAKKTQLKLD